MTVQEPIPLNPDFAETTKRFLLEMPIARHFGFEVTSIGPGRFEITQPFREDRLSARASSRPVLSAPWLTWRRRAPA